MVVVYVVGILTCGLGFYFGPPIAAAVLVPLAVATVGGLAAMEWAYVMALLRLNRAIRDAG